MSDYGIVGMGHVHVLSPNFIEKSDKTTTCDLECTFLAKGKGENLYLIKVLHTFILRYHQCQTN